MRTLGNILWHIPFLGFLNATVVFLFGLLLTVTVVAAPIGLGLMEYGKFLFAPYGRTMISKASLHPHQNKAWKTYSTIVSFLYVPIGVLACLIAIIQIVLLCLTVVGIPVAVVIAKSLGTYLNPVNKVCVPTAIAEEIVRRKAQVEVTKYLDS